MQQYREKQMGPNIDAYVWYKRSYAGVKWWQHAW